MAASVKDSALKGGGFHREMCIPEMAERKLPFAILADTANRPSRECMLTILMMAEPRYSRMTWRSWRVPRQARN